MNFHTFGNIWIHPFNYMKIPNKYPDNLNQKFIDFYCKRHVFLETFLNNLFLKNIFWSEKSNHENLIAIFYNDIMKNLDKDKRLNKLD